MAFKDSHSIETVLFDTRFALMQRTSNPNRIGLRREASATDSPGTIVEYTLVVISYLIIILTLPLSLFFVFKVVQHFERAVILRNGRLRKGNFGPGLVFLLPCIDTISLVDLRIYCFAIAPQEALTKDSLSVSVDAVVYYRIFDPIAAMMKTTGSRYSIELLAATALRNALGTRRLQDLLKERKEIKAQVQAETSSLSHKWGIDVLRVEIKDIRLPIQLQKAMAAEAESSRLANAKIIVANSEIEATRNLQQAAAILSDNPLCMQLRYLQSLHVISGPWTHTVVFPLSVASLQQLFSKCTR